MLVDNPIAAASGTELASSAAPSTTVEADSTGPPSSADVDAELGAQILRAHAASRMFWYGALQVIFQIAAAGALIYGTAIPSCSDNDMCDDQGMFCWTARNDFGTSGSCFYCGNDTPLEVIETPDGTLLNEERVHDSTGTVLPLASVEEKLAFTGVWNMTLIRGLCMNWPDWPHDSKLDKMDDWSDTALVNWCDRCVHFETGHVDPQSLSRLAMANKLGMRFMDWLALLVTAVVIALSFVGELKDKPARSGPPVGAPMQHMARGASNPRPMEDEVGEPTVKLIVTLAEARRPSTTHAFVESHAQSTPLGRHRSLRRVLPVLGQSRIGA